MTEQARIPVKGQTPDAQNGGLAAYIGDKPWKIESINREPAKNENGEEKNDGSEEWVLHGEF